MKDHFAHCPSKWLGPLYRSKIKVSQGTPCGYSKPLSQDDKKKQKTRNKYDHSGLRKHFGIFLMVFRRFLSQG